MNILEAKEALKTINSKLNDAKVSKRTLENKLEDLKTELDSLKLQCTTDFDCEVKDLPKYITDLETKIINTVKDIQNKLSVLEVE
jgi:predicted  nucleic acid-binding Zn-ribbon protein